MVFQGYIFLSPKKAFYWIFDYLFCTFIWIIWQYCTFIDCILTIFTPYSLHNSKQIYPWHLKLPVFFYYIMDWLDHCWYCPHGLRDNHRNMSWYTRDGILMDNWLSFLYESSTINRSSCSAVGLWSMSASILKHWLPYSGIVKVNIFEYIIKYNLIQIWYRILSSIATSIK